MSAQPPSLDKRRQKEFLAELQARAQAWIPDWCTEDGEHDFGRALLDIAARFNAEVAEQLDQTGEKMRRGFLDWLAVQRQAAEPARLPVVFKIAEGAKQSVLAPAPVRLQADAEGTQVVFETTNDVRLVPGTLKLIVGADTQQDRITLAPPDFCNFEPLEPLPTEWRCKATVSPGSSIIQLEPETGLLPGTILEFNDQQYSIKEADKDLVTIEPPFADKINVSDVLRKQSAFAPFDEITRNKQEHILYIGDEQLLQIETATTIIIDGLQGAPSNIVWEYWGKTTPESKPDWLPLETIPASERVKAAPKNSNVKETTKTPPDAFTDAIHVKKTAGKFEPKEIKRKKSRWIRGRIPQLPDPSINYLFEEVRLGIKSESRSVDSTAVDGPVVEAMSNSTPLVVSKPFYPLGKVPRQFDAFYLGCAEAFSKKNAAVKVQFTLADSAISAFSLHQAAPDADLFLAGVGNDGDLHIYKIDQAGKASLFRSSQPEKKPEVPSDPTQKFQLNPECTPVWAVIDNTVYIYAAAGKDIWRWKHSNNKEEGAWDLNPIPTPSTDKPYKIVQLLNLKNTWAVLLSETKTTPVKTKLIFLEKGEWIKETKNHEGYLTIAPIYLDSAKDPSGDVMPNKLIAVTSDKQLAELTLDLASAYVEKRITKELLHAGKFKSSSVQPVAFTNNSKLLIAAVNDVADTFVLLTKENTEFSFKGEFLFAGKAMTFARQDNEIQYWLSEQDKDTFEVRVVEVTAPRENLKSTILSKNSVAFISESHVGNPAFNKQRIFLPGPRSELYLLKNAAPRSHSSNIIQGLVFEKKNPFSAFNKDFILSMRAVETENSSRPEWRVNKNPLKNSNGDIYYPIDTQHVITRTDNPMTVRAFDVLNPGVKAKRLSSTTIQVPDIKELSKGDSLRVQTSGSSIVFVVDIDAKNKTIEIEPPFQNGTPKDCEYWKGVAAKATLVPVIDIPSDGGEIGNKLAKADSIHILNTNKFVPSVHEVSLFNDDSGTAKAVILQPWESVNSISITERIDYVVIPRVGNWTAQLGETVTDRELSWEYWNSTGWWSLVIDEDGTDQFSKSGTLKFSIPNDLTESDWSGKKNFWIRARLIAGDFGKEIVTVTTTPVPGTTQTTQSVERDTDHIKAPVVNRVIVSYSNPGGVLPQYVLTADNLTTRDQTEANRTGNARVEAFLPLHLMLQRFTGEVIPDVSGNVTALPASTGLVGGGTSAQPNDSASNISKIERFEIFLGIKAPLSEGPVKIFFLAEREEIDSSGMAMLEVEALIAGRFVAIQCEDETHALHESGMLTLSFTTPPTTTELFNEELCWLRLKPRQTPENWKPNLRGVFLNAVWAQATETMTRELLGSSEGEPELRHTLARPPLLLNTLELRVREPLSDGERISLQQEDKKQVLSDVENLPGDWVLWKQVVDPLDESDDARVYSLDEASGEIRFGDGQHGRIPPIGRDSIVAFSYKRTEANPNSEKVAGNLIKPRTSLNLVTPVETVEAVFAADQAGGGTAPESDDRVLRFGFARLRHRDRVVSGRDLEELTLQSSRDFAQVRAIVRAHQIKLVIVTRGMNPLPSAVQIRALRRYLAQRLPTNLNNPRALQITGPTLRYLQFKFELLIESLDHVAGVTGEIKQRINKLFDSATGGDDQLGWQLGRSPCEQDIAESLLDVPHLLSITSITLLEQTTAGQLTAWPGRIKKTDLVRLTSNPLVLDFKTPEVSR